ncbi:MAG: hypothetical protein COZ34_01620 [Candidatus Pacebacteria bacterium CG_4_10_14_3_um_filter_34_15]|nr:MAG: hypothetical protein COZ34_01620 [Candidatus Pacebacteria bacterium CG_4_10_14_3_um_filter_34_15]
MKNLLKKGKLVFNKYWPVFLILLVTICIGLTNYQINKWLIGWDSYTPNFNFTENFERNIFGIWQEDRGLGLPDGMSHIANVIHTLTIFVLSFIFPSNSLRFVYHLLMYFFGGVGSYFLIKKFTNDNIVSALGSLFFLLNLSTLQMFHLPLEVFSVHFAALPWLTLTLLNFLKKQNFKNAFNFFLISFLTSPQGYVPTIFGVYAILFLTIILFQFQKTKKFLKTVTIASLLLFLSNAFWIIPYSFNLSKSLNTISNATINVMSNEAIRLKNQEYGDLESVVMGKGMYLSLYEEDAKPLLQPWITHTQQPIVRIFSWSIWLVTLVGLLYIIYERKKTLYPFITLYLFSFLLLGNSIPFLSKVLELINTYIPVFANAYRFIFTKFSILYMFNYSILFAFGLKIIFSKFKSQLTSNNLFLLMAGMMIYIAKPSFQSNFFSQYLMLAIPEKYFQLQEFFESKPTAEKIQVLPQADFWGWTFNDWGFKGSGFVWQMLPQATMDGAFLPWSEKNESYYLELDQALISNDAIAFDDTLNKYQINWIVIDESIIKKDKKIDLASTYNVINNSEVLILEKEIENIKIYHNTQVANDNFIFTPNKISFIDNTCTYCRNDSIFSSKGHYLNKEKSAVYPFQYLFSERNIEKNISKNDLQNILNLKPKLYNIESTDFSVKLPSLVQLENYDYPVKISNDNKVLRIEIYYPYQILTNDKQLFNPVLLSIVRSNENEFTNYLVTISNKQFSIPKEFPETIDYVNLKTSDDILFELLGVNENQTDDFLYTPKLLESVSISNQLNKNITEIESNIYKVDANTGLVVSILPKSYQLNLSESTLTLNCGVNQQGIIEKNTINNSVDFSAFDKGAICDFYGVGYLNHNTGYLLNFEGENITGKNLEFFIHNWITDQIDFEAVLNEGKFSQCFTLLPQKNINGNGYSVNFKLNSFRYNDSESILNSTTIYPIPLDIISQIELLPNNFDIKTSEGQNNNLKVLSSKHISPVLYKIETSYDEDGYFGLLQSFDNNWIALAHPLEKSELNFRSYTKLSHYQLNNWANSWKVPAGEYSIIIFYWPQFITCVSFVLSIGTSIYIFKNTLKVNNKHIKKTLKINFKTKQILKGKN